MNINDNIRVSATPPAKLTSKAVKAKKKEAPKKAAPGDSVSLSGKTKYDMTEGNYAEALENGDKILDKIDTMVTGAEKAVQVQMYRLGHNKIVDVLAQQAKKGVKVQVLLDPTPGYDAHDAEDQAQIQNYLKSAGVEILRYPIDKPRGKIDHVKMLIVDGKSLLIGGMNWDKHSPINQDSDVYLRGPIVKDSSDVFNHDWKLAGGEVIAGLKAPGKQKDANAKVRIATTEVDRKDINTVLQSNIKGAKKSIKMEAFALADKTTIANLIDAKERGVDVKVLLDPNRPIYFVNKKSAAQLKEHGIEVKWFDIDIDKREKLHAKLALFDEDKTIIGSCNFTKAGLEVNHEADVEVISKSVGTAFNKMFDEHWDSKALDRAPSIPDFNERVPEKPVKEQMAREIYRYFTKVFRPDNRRVFAGKRKAAVLQNIEKYDQTDKAAPVEGLGKSGQENLINEKKEMASIGDIASFVCDLEDFKMDPMPGDRKPVYDRRVEIAEEKGSKVHEQVPRYVNDMINAVQDKDLKAFLKEALEKAPKGFYMAPSSVTGRHHPADEVDPADANLSHNANNGEYKGGGLVLHVRRTQKMGEKLCDHYGVTGKQKDEILTALALHDIMKGVTMDDLNNSLENGTEIPWNDTTTPDHGPVGAEWLKSLDKSKGKKLTKNVRRYIEAHMSIWNKPDPRPAEDIGEFITSMSDYTVSQNQMYLEV